MKRIAFFITFLFLTLLVNAQDYKNAVGIRAGIPFGPSGVTLRHFLDKQNAVEGILAGNFGTSITITGLYENEHWTGYYPSLNWYWGLGAHVGFMDASANRFIPNSFTGGGILGVDGIFGVEYTFDEIPLNISVDIMPSFNIAGYTGFNFISSGVSARYIF
jgi:hypothetical protein